MSSEGVAPSAEPEYRGPKPTVGPVLKSISPTAVKSFSPDYDGGCPRKHWLNKRCGIGTPQSASQVLGEDVHSQLEGLMLDGTPPKFESAIHLSERPGFPSRRPDLLIEWPKNYKLDIQAAGVDVRGKIDLVVPPLPDASDGHIATWDYKTTGSFDWAASAETLALDPQGLVYNWAMAKRFVDAKTFSFTHAYVHTKQVDSRIVTADPMTRSELEGAYAEVIVPVAEEMKASFTADKLEDVKPNWGACDAFGGCPYRKFCGSRPIESFGAGRKTMSEAVSSGGTGSSSLDLDSLIAARKVEQSVAAPPRSGINPTDAAPPPVPVTYKVPDTSYVMPAVPEDALTMALRNLELAVWQIYQAVGRKPLVFTPAPPPTT